MSFRALLVASVAGLLACSGTQARRPYPNPGADALVSHLRDRQARATSFFAESKMEYWQGDRRVKSTVLILGERGAKARFQALDPTDQAAADLACDGVGFQYVDFHKNCQLSGTCDRSAVHQLLRVSLQPDDFLLLAIGSTPLLANPTATAKWDPDEKVEKLTLRSADGRRTQTVILSGVEGTWDVLSSTLVGPDGKVEWTLANGAFETMKSEDGQTFRVPTRTRFEQPAEKTDLSVRWVDRQINIEISEDKFHMADPGAIPVCGRKTPNAG